MDLTISYIDNQVTEEEYYAYRERKAQEYMELYKKSLGENSTFKELKNAEFSFKRGMDTVTQQGRFITREAINS
ncbi:hypothetical protein LAV82_22725 [Bacillus sp. ILBB4]|nr:hypothetical protein [Bacillus sp. ILBB4]